MNMYQDTLQSHRHDESSEEIDLLELCATLWRSKWLIAAAMMVCVIPTALWLMWQPPIYKLEALLDTTSPYDIQALQPTLLPDGASYQVEPLKSEDFYQNLLTQAVSLNTQRLFWEHRSQQPLSPNPREGITKNDIAFKQFFNSLTLTPPNPKNQNTTLSQLALETPEPTRDMETLTAFVGFLNAHVVEMFANQLEKGYQSNLQKLEADYATMLMREQQKLQDELLKLRESLSLAQSLNITETPYEQLAGVELKVVDDRQYLLGTRVLSQEIKSLEARAEKPLSAFVPELRNMEYWQQTMQNDVERLGKVKDDVQAFTLASPVVSSLDPVKPKKLLILIGSLFLSLIIGVVIVLIANGVKNYHARTDNL